MDPTGWFDDLPVIGKLPPEQAIIKLREVGEDDVADMLEMTQEAETKAFRSPDFRSWLHLQDRPWEHTAHTFGYLAPASPGNAPLPIQSIGAVAADASLKHARIKITLSRLRVASYPGGGMHRVLLHFFAQNQLPHNKEDLHFNATYRVREGEHAGIHGYPIFIGLNVGDEGLSFRCHTINVSNDQDEAFLDFLESDVFKAGLKLVNTAQPVIAPFSELALGIATTIAKRNHNVSVHDLAITLTPPPNDAQPDVIASISLNFAQPLGLNHSGDLLHDPLTQKERDDLHWYLEEYWKWPFEGFAQRARGIEDLLPKLGKRLYESVFGSRQADRIVQKWLSTEGDHQISIISDLPHALSLPWELLHSEQGYLVMRTQEPVSILRRLPQSESTTASTPFEPPLRVLLVTARPQGTGFIDPRGIARELLDELQEQGEMGAIELEFLRPPTVKALRKRLRDKKRQVHVLHFDGHGT